MGFISEEKCSNEIQEDSVYIEGDLNSIVLLNWFLVIPHYV